MIMPHDGPDRVPGVRPEDDPATPELRRKLTLGLLVKVIRRYEETLAATRYMDAAYPVLALPRQSLDEAELAERRAWGRLVDQHDHDFDTAELSLASMIHHLYGDVACEGSDVDREVLGDFVERAIRFEGTLYVLNYDVVDYEAGTNIIGVVRQDRVYDLGDYPCEPEA